MEIGFNMLVKGLFPSSNLKLKYIVYTVFRLKQMLEILSLTTLFWFFFYRKLKVSKKQLV